MANNRGVTSVSHDMLICRLKSYKSQLLRATVAEKKISKTEKEISKLYLVFATKKTKRMQQMKEKK